MSDGESDPETAQIRVDKNAAMMSFTAHERAVVNAVQATEYEVAAGFATSLYLRAAQLPGWWHEYRAVGDEMVHGEPETPREKEDYHEEMETRAAFKELHTWAEANDHPAADWFKDDGVQTMPVDDDSEIVPWEDLSDAEKQQFTTTLQQMGVDVDSVEEAEPYYGNPEKVERESETHD